MSGEHDGSPHHYEYAACGLITTAQNGLIRRTNLTFAQWLGYEKEELVGKIRLQDLLTMGCKIFHQTHWIPLLRLQGSVAEVQLEFVHRNGNVLPVLVNAQCREGTSAQEHEVAVFVATDRRKYERELLLARKRAEELLERERAAQEALSVAEGRLRHALDSAHLLVWHVDPKTGLPAYESGVRGLLDLTADQPLTAQSYADCIHVDDRETERLALEAALAPEGDGLYAVEYRLRSPSGAERVVSSSGHAFFDSAGKLLRFSGVLQDVTARHRAEKMLREQEQDAQQRALLAEQLVGIVSHDLRSPLHAVSLGTSLLNSSNLSPTQQRLSARITSASTRANRLIDDLLDFTQARLGGGLRVDRQKIDLHALIADCVDDLKLAWPGRTIEHRSEGDGLCSVDPDRLAQVVTNLGNNAMTYGAPGSPVTIVSSLGERELCLRVHNHGPPVPPGLLPHLFEPMQRGEQQVRRGSRSVGLGLYIVHQIAVAHDGWVTVDSCAETGTSFLVSLPR